MNTRTTINVDEEILREVKKTVASRSRGNRNLSQAIEEAMRNYNTTSALISYVKAEGIPIDTLPSFSEVVDRRQSVDWSDGAEVREMRGERAAGLH